MSFASAWSFPSQPASSQHAPATATASLLLQLPLQTLHLLLDSRHLLQVQVSSQHSSQRQESAEPGLESKRCSQLRSFALQDMDAFRHLGHENRLYTPRDDHGVENEKARRRKEIEATATDIGDPVQCSPHQFHIQFKTLVSHSVQNNCD